MIPDTRLFLFQQSQQLISTANEITSVVSSSVRPLVVRAFFISLIIPNVFNIAIFLCRCNQSVSVVTDLSKFHKFYLQSITRLTAVAVQLFPIGVFSPRLFKQSAIFANVLMPVSRISEMLFCAILLNSCFRF